MVTHQEWHRLVGETTARLSSVLFRQRSGTSCGVEWLHVHETWLPGQAPAAGERYPQAATD